MNFKKKISQDLKRYVDVKQEYRSMNLDKTEFLTTKAFRIFSMLSKWDVQASMNLKNLEVNKEEMQKELNESY